MEMKASNVIRHVRDSGHSYETTNLHVRTCIVAQFSISYLHANGCLRSST